MHAAASSSQAAMEAAFCLRPPAIGVPPKSRLLDAAAAGSSHLPRGVIRRVSFSTAAPPPARNDSDDRCRKVVRAAGAAIIVACSALGSLYLSISPRGARAVGSGSFDRSSSIAAKMDGSPGAPGGLDDGGLHISIEELGSIKTPLLLGKMLLPEPELPGGGKKMAEQPSAVLLQHFYSNILSPGMQLELMELILNGSPVLRHAWLPPNERMEAAVALAQIYFDSKNYEKTEEVMSQLIKNYYPIHTSDARIPLIQAITSMMLALEQELLPVPQGKNMEEEKKKRSEKILHYIADARANWKVYKDVVKIFPLSPPHVTDDDDNNI